MSLLRIPFLGAIVVGTFVSHESGVPVPPNLVLILSAHRYPRWRTKWGTSISGFIKNLQFTLLTDFPFARRRGAFRSPATAFDFAYGPHQNETMTREEEVTSELRNLRTKIDALERTVERGSLDLARNAFWMRTEIRLLQWDLPITRLEASM